MAGTVKGITITFAGDTTKLDKALRQVRNSTKDIDKELNQVNRALKFNPRNTELLAQKQTLLKQKVEQTSKSLKDLKDMQAQMDAQKVDPGSEEYRKLQREIITTESKLKHFKGQLQQVALESSKIYQVGQAFEDTGKKIEGAGYKLSGVSKAAGAVTAAMGAVTYKAGAMADDLNTLSKVTGVSTYDLQMYAAMADLVDVSVETMAKSHQKLKKSMLSASEGKAQAEYFQQLGVAVTDSNGNLRDANDVFNETIAALGQMENETERDAIAMQLFGKSAGDLNPLIEDAGATYAKVSEIMAKHGLEPVSQEALDKANEFNDSIDTIKLVFLQAVQIIGTKMAGYLAPLMDKIANKVASFAEWFAKLDGKTLSRIMGILAAVSLISPALIVVGKTIGMVGKAIKTVTTIINGLSTALSFVAANPIVLVIAGIVALVAALVVLWTKSEKFRKVVSSVWYAITTTVTNAVETIKATFTAAAEVIKKTWNALTGFFRGVWNGIKTVFAPVANFFRTVFYNAFTIVRNIWIVASTIFSSAWSAIKAVFAPVGSFFQGVWNQIKAPFEGVVGWFSGKFSQAWSAITRVFSGVGRFFSGVWQSIARVFTNIGQRIGQAIGNAFRGAINALLTTAERVLNAPIRILNSAISVLRNIPGLRGLGTLREFHLPRMAKGGVLNGAQTVIAGEAGPEAIIPLDKLFAQMDKMAETIRGSGGGDNVVINVYGAPGQDINQLAAIIERKLTQMQKRREAVWA